MSPSSESLPVSRAIRWALVAIEEERARTGRSAQSSAESVPSSRTIAATASNRNRQTASIPTHARPLARPHHLEPSPFEGILLFLLRGERLLLARAFEEQVECLSERVLFTLGKQMNVAQAAQETTGNLSVGGVLLANAQDVVGRHAENLRERAYALESTTYKV